MTSFLGVKIHSLLLMEILGLGSTVVTESWDTVITTSTLLYAALEHIQTCHRERDSREQQMESLKDRIEKLNAAINICQEQLPASGAPITRQVRLEGIRELIVWCISF